MSAVVSMLNENLVEALKGFYKMRKAYITLDAILEAERKYKTSKPGTSTASTRRPSFSSSRSKQSTISLPSIPGSFDEQKSTAKELQHLSSKNQSVNRVALMEKSEGSGVFNPATSDTQDSVNANGYNQQISTPETYRNHIASKEHHIDLTQTSTSLTEPAFPYSPRSPTKSKHFLLEHDPDAEVFASPIDAFVHSGANLCFGLILLLLSIIPPALGKVLSVIGFQGDRQRGIRMLWQSSKFHNINGAMAGLMILGYYNAVVGYCDILPDSPPPPSSASAVHDDIEGYPAHRLEDLLINMRSRYPRSQLWLLEEARMAATKKRLDVAIDILSAAPRSQLKQVEALSMFEKSLNAMYSHRYQLCCEAFLECVRLNDWSHALYKYIAGSAQVELYRQAKIANNEALAAEHASLATELIHSVREHAGKKKFLSRPLPFDAFVVRKLDKWEARAKEWGVPFIDAIGVSPLEEMIYLWNGTKRMPSTTLEASLLALAWSENPACNPHWHHEGLDESALLALLRAGVYRNLGRHEEAKQLLNTEIIAHDWASFKGHLKDDWTCPAAHYEMAANLWMERDGRETDLAKVNQAEEWIEKAAKWEGYDLDTRIGLKVKTGLNTIKDWRVLYNV